MEKWGTKWTFPSSQNISRKLQWDPLCTISNLETLGWPSSAYAVTTCAHTPLTASMVVEASPAILRSTQGRCSNCVSDTRFPWSCPWEVMNTSCLALLWFSLPHSLAWPGPSTACRGRWFHCIRGGVPARCSCPSWRSISCWWIFRTCVEGALPRSGNKYEGALYSFLCAVGHSGYLPSPQFPSYLWPLL